MLNDQKYSLYCKIPIHEVEVMKNPKDSQWLMRLFSRNGFKLTLSEQSSAKEVILLGDSRVEFDDRFVFVQQIYPLSAGTVSYVDTDLNLRLWSLPNSDGYESAKNIADSIINEDGLEIAINTEYS